VDAGEARWGAVLAQVWTVACTRVADFLRLDARHKRGAEEEQDDGEHEGPDGRPREPCHASRRRDATKKLPRRTACFKVEG